VTSSPPVAYLDSSALVELIAIEAETAALRQELRRWPDRASSLLASIEVTRAARRLGGHAPALAARVVAGLRLLAIDPIVPAAAEIGGTTLRSLDAIHLATALSISAEPEALITYDNRMISHSQAIGLPVISPA
jgi:predicted nucleic acid-binding protein